MFRLVLTDLGDPYGGQFSAGPGKPAGLGGCATWMAAERREAVRAIGA